MPRGAGALTQSLTGLALATAVLAAPAAAAAQEAFVGVFQHDAQLHLLTNCCYEGGADIQFGARTAPLVSHPKWGAIYAYGTGSVNTEGGVDFASAGLGWRVRFGPGKRLYVQPAVGVAVQDGSHLRYQRDPSHLYLGSAVLFEPEVALGYELNPRWNVELAIDHLSHGKLNGPQNPGMDDIGVRAVYRFGR